MKKQKTTNQLQINNYLLNLPHTVSENSTVKATYKYVANGTKRYGNSKKIFNRAINEYY